VVVYIDAGCHWSAVLAWVNAVRKNAAAFRD
jgi:hypothetical protein